MIRFTTFLALTVLFGAPVAIADDLAAEFPAPPASARPGVYWTIQDGNQDRDEMVADMDGLHAAGYGCILFMEVDLGFAKGPVPFMSTQWVDNIANTFVHAGNLGMEVIIMTGPGWTGSGGPWTPIEDSMKHLVGSSVQVTGPGTLNQVLPVPPPHPANPYAGMNGTLAAQRNAWFEDVAVLAYRTPPAGAATIGTANTLEVNAKILKDLLPYSSSGVARNLPLVMPQASYPEPGVGGVLDESQVIDLTPLLQPDGSINWTIPAGDWTVMRFVARSTGQTSRPAPAAGYGLENDKFDGATFRAHWNKFHKVLIGEIKGQGGPLQPGVGLTTIHLDSWEMSSQNWTAAFRQEFQTRRGYDPQPFYPAWMGMVVGSREETERFLWDMRKTSQELVLEEYAGEIRQVAHENGLLYSNQPYDMNPAGDMDLVSVADIPSCEFWNDTFNTQYGVIESVSTARTMGPQLVRAEAFTSGNNSFAKNPANMKIHTDWAFAIGINGFVYHGSAHQPLGDDAKPGMTFGVHGINLSRHNTIWNHLPDFNRYLARCSHMLRQGEAVSDILYLAPEAAPHVFEAPADATEGPATMRDKRGYSFDAVTPRILAMRAVVEGDRIAFPDGSKYRVLVLPNVPTMTPEALTKIGQLVQAGATIIGKPPVKSPSLVNYPACDTEVSTMATAMWGGTTAPGTVTALSRGSGKIYWGGNLEPGAALYPSYAAKASLLAGLGLAEDFTSPSGKLRYLHRVTADRDIYFVSNRTMDRFTTTATFRIDGLAPQLWDPHTGETRALEDYANSGGVTTMPLTFEPAQSYFVVFPHASAGSTPPASPGPNFQPLSLAAELDGTWAVAFDPALGGPASVTFESLVDWTQRPEPGIRYYSGTAIYTKGFDVPGYDPADGHDYFLDVGTLNGLCRVRLNGQDLGVAWTAPWRVKITPALQAGGNQLEIEVVNNWVNRLIGDKQPADANARTLSWPSGLLGGGPVPAGRYSYVTNSAWNAGSPLQSAGLLGPVSVLTSGPDMFPPASTGFTPADDSTTTFLPSKLQVTFSEPVTRGSGNITIRNLSDSTEVAIGVADGSQVSVADGVLTITPSGGLLADRNYAVRIAPGAVTDLSGTPYGGIADDTTWNFITGSASAVALYQEDFEELQPSDPDVVDGGAAGIFTATTWPTAPEIVLSGAANLLKPAPGSVWLSPLPAELGTTFAILHSGVSATITLADTFSDNKTYELSFTHFRRDDLAGDAVTAKILAADGTELIRQEFPAVGTADTFLTRTLTWTTNGGAEVGQAIRIQWVDPNGGASSQQAAIDNILLLTGKDDTVLETGSLSPPDDATDAAADADLVISFNREIMAGSGFITLKRTSDDSTVEAFAVASSTRLGFSGSTLTIDPTGNLADGTSYHVLIDAAAITGLSGEPFAGIGDGSTWNFTTAGAGRFPISVNNPSFEDDVYASPGASGFLVSGWTRIGNPGTGRTDTPQYPGGVPDGVNYAWTNFAVDGFRQTLAVDLEADTTYTLTAATGWRADLPATYPTYPGYRIELWAGGFMLGFDAYTTTGGTGTRPTAGTWKDVTVTYTSGPTVTPGQALEIRLLAGNNVNGGSAIQTNYDNVRLTAETPAGGGDDFTTWISGFHVGGQTGLDDDPDGDGIPNGVENHFGTEPDAFSLGLVAAADDGGAGTFTFTHPQGTLAGDLTAAYQWSKDLVTFHADGGTDGDGTSVAFTPDPDTPSPGTTTVTATVTGVASSNVFVRVQVTQV